MTNLEKRKRVHNNFCKAEQETQNSDLVFISTAKLNIFRTKCRESANINVQQWKNLNPNSALN
jgi:hypothetical protein